jgi:hypothetical protein
MARKSKDLLPFLFATNVNDNSGCRWCQQRWGQIATCINDTGDK